MGNKQKHHNVRLEVLMAVLNSLVGCDAMQWSRMSATLYSISSQKMGVGSISASHSISTGGLLFWWCIELKENKLVVNALLLVVVV